MADRILEVGVREITGSDQASLASAIRDGTVPRPPLLDWKDWQVWRRDLGKRPKVGLGDPRSTTSREESALWRGTMARVHGLDWRAVLEEQQAAVEEEEERSLLAGAAPAGSGASEAGGATRYGRHNDPGYVLQRIWGSSGDPRSP